MTENHSSGQKKRWDEMEPKKRKKVQASMKAGQQKARQRKKLLTKKNRSNMTNTFLLADKLAEVYAMAGGREQVIRLLDIVELVYDEVE
tara:strand:+ start:571 stop:837 length:267 start_codon:yes stop_codon:yes gene_type:complete